ncbi:C/D box methylation guide ribonucleoprotein complex aNOP56 subunit [Candidatus Thorarchaeota archaeon]|nr:MAG: C/D box methylation guide ribonucleoprotein complex aNOP56 subunit [Candidatus Thorarchaeota archaeon]
MPVYLALSAFGTFVLDEKNEVLAKHVVYPDVGQAVSNLLAIGEGEATPMTDSIAAEIEKLGEKEVFVEEQMLARCFSKFGNLVVTIRANKIAKWFRGNQNEYLTKLGITKTPEEISSFQRDVAIRLSKAKVSAASGEKDLLVKNAIDGIDEVDKSINVLVMRLREWYSVHHPSLTNLVEDQDQYAKILRETNGKESMTRDMLESAGVPEATIEQVMAAIPGDIGAELRDIDLSIIKTLAIAIDNMYQTRKELEDYVGTVMEEISPNVAALVGPLVGARLISLAGSLEDLARKPSSTVQVFGAEKALFRSLKTGADPPKHGIIYRVSEINSAPYWQRGKIARALAGKLSIAARIDAYSDRNIGTSLRDDFLARVEEIRKQNPTAPPPKPPKPKSEEKKRQQRRDYPPKRDRKRDNSRRGGRR